jgi:O-antigen ligase
MLLIDRAAIIAVLVTPLLLLHARSVADGVIVTTGLLLLARSWLGRDWGWLRARWTQIALLWWGWIVFCSLPIAGLGPGGWRSLGEGVAVIRFLLFLAVMDYWVLRDARTRRCLFWIVAACAAWIGVECLQQLATGHNLFGYARAGDGVLTGPFDKQLAGPELARILLPVLVPPAAWLLGRRKLLATVGAYALLLAGVSIMVLIGQRMPLMITGLGLVVAALLLPRLRPVVIAAGVAGLVLLAATPMVSPPAYHRLVLTFSTQIEDFPVTQYGQLYARAWHIGVARPLVGRGFDGFRTGCPLPEYFGPTFGGAEPDGGGAAICAGHPHNFYLQALAAGGFAGLVLFCAAVVAWMAPLLRGLWRQPDPLRVGLFTAAFIQLWPLASTSDFVSMPIGGWFFLTLGWALAESRWRVPVRAAQPDAASAGVLKDAKLA